MSEGERLPRGGVAVEFNAALCGEFIALSEANRTATGRHGGTCSGHYRVVLATPMRAGLWEWEVKLLRHDLAIEFFVSVGPPAARVDGPGMFCVESSRLECVRPLRSVCGAHWAFSYPHARRSAPICVPRMRRPLDICISLYACPIYRAAWTCACIRVQVRGAWRRAGRARPR